MSELELVDVVRAASLLGLPRRFEVRCVRLSGRLFGARLGRGQLRAEGQHTRDGSVLELVSSSPDGVASLRLCVDSLERRLGRGPGPASLWALAGAGRRRSPPDAPTRGRAAERARVWVHRTDDPRVLRVRFEGAWDGRGGLERVEGELLYGCPSAPHHRAADAA